MLTDFPAMPVLAVSDLDRARSFYEQTLGLTSVGQVTDAVIYQAGGVQILVYQSAYAGTNRATAISFQLPLDAFDEEVADLRGRGITFQTFDMDGITWTDGVADMDGTRALWFTDPDGNVINVEAGPDQP